MDGDTTIDGASVQDTSGKGNHSGQEVFSGAERRQETTGGNPDRRRLTWKTLYISLTRPRRQDVRRTSGTTPAYVDFHAPHLLAVAIIILVFCMLDGVIAVHLASLGAMELNPAIAALIERDAVQVAIAKWLLTATAVVALIIAERARIFGRIRAVVVLYGIMAGYLLLVPYSLFVALTLT